MARGPVRQHRRRELLRVAERYDGRARACLFTWDDLQAGTEDAYITMATAAAARGIWVSPGINPNQPTLANVSKCQQLVDLGNVEIVNHSYTHKNPNDADYDAATALVEIDQADSWITTNLTLHPFSRYGSAQFVHS